MLRCSRRSWSIKQRAGSYSPLISSLNSSLACSLSFWSSRSSAGNFLGGSWSEVLLTPNARTVKPSEACQLWRRKVFQDQFPDLLPEDVSSTSCTRRRRRRTRERAHVSQPWAFTRSTTTGRSLRRKTLLRVQRHQKPTNANLRPLPRTWNSKTTDWKMPA